MSTLLLEPTSTAQWHRLVCEAEQSVNINLEEDLESYLVFLLMRFAQKPDIGSYVVALEFLKTAQTTGRISAEKLQKIGDICLLLSGLFPLRALKRCVRVSYFVNIGKTAYDLHSQHSKDLEPLFQNLASKFVALMDVLQATRNLDKPELVLFSPLQAYELWEDLGSLNAKKTLEKAATGAISLPKIVLRKQ